MRLTGYESIFDTSPWKYAVNSANCYDYAIGDFEVYRKVKSTPGDRAGLSSHSLKVTSCSDLRRRILKDNKKTVYKCSNPSKVCKRGYYKIMNFVSPDGGDFHFYKQNRGVRYKVKSGDTVASLAKFFKVRQSVIKKSGPITPGKTIEFPCNLWSHKRGWGDVPIMTDASGKTIKDPRKSNRKYPGLNYSKFCGAFCVRANRAGSGSLSRPGLASLRPLNKLRI